MLNPPLTPYLSAKRWLVAFSGGLDSTVLLHLLSQVTSRPPILAVYIHHGLQAVADDWQLHCQTVAASFTVDFVAVKVDVAKNRSMEDEARKARYQAFAQLIQQDDVLFMGHHGHDQLETMLFRLLRGTGLRGLKGIPKQRAFEQGIIARPLLSYSLVQLEAYAQRFNLPFVTDPSNFSTVHDRNFIRQKLIPAMEERWPLAADAAVQTAEHLVEAQDLLEEIAHEDSQHLASEHWGMPCWNLTAWQQLSELRQKNSLRYWLYQQGVVLSNKQWHSLLVDIVPAASTKAQLQLAGRTIRLYQQRLYLVDDQPLNPLQEQDWHTAKPLMVAGLGKFYFEPALSCVLQIKARQGGEKLQLQANRPRQSLKDIFQMQQVPPWLRDKIPLIYYQDELVAIGHLASSIEAGKLFGQSAIRFSCFD